jgi:hypothetical protein
LRVRGRPSGRKHGQALACPARGAARPVSPYPPRKRTPGTRDEQAFDSQKRNRNYKNPLTGSVHASRGLPDGSKIRRIAVGLSAKFCMTAKLSNWTVDGFCAILSA